MPRQRMVKPEFFDSESLAECSFGARLLFIGLWVMGDDFGNQKAQLNRLNRRVFPLDSVSPDDFRSMLCELERVGCIKGYEIDGERYINIPNFGTYQTINRPTKTSVPEPPEKVVRAKLTNAIEGWGKPVENPPAHAQFSECSVSAHAKERKERKKEGPLKESLPKEEGVCGAGAAEAAPPPPYEVTQACISEAMEAIRRCPA